MDYDKKFLVEPGKKIHLAKIDPSCPGKHRPAEEEGPETHRHIEAMDKLRYQLYEDVLTSTKHAPWYVIPANHKWFRNVAISQIVTKAKKPGLKPPPTHVDIEDIRRQYHAARHEQHKADAKNAKSNRHHG